MQQVLQIGMSPIEAIDIPVADVCREAGITLEQLQKVVAYCEQMTQDSLKDCPITLMGS